MIYSTSNKKRCLEAALKKTINNCNNNYGCRLQPICPLPCLMNIKKPLNEKNIKSDVNLEVNEKSNNIVMEELYKIKQSIEEMQLSIAKLPQQIVAALSENRHCLAIRGGMINENENEQLSINISDIDIFSDVADADTSNVVSTDDDYSMLSSFNSGCCSTINPNNRSRSCSSDIEVLNYCPSTVVNQTSPIMMNNANNDYDGHIDISKEILHLTKAWKSIESKTFQLSNSPSSATFQVSTDATTTSNLFSHWSQRYETSINIYNKMKNPNLDSTSSDITADVSIGVPCRYLDASTFPKLQVPKILPYSPTIDLNVWLK